MSRWEVSHIHVFKWREETGSMVTLGPVRNMKARVLAARAAGHGIDGGGYIHSNSQRGTKRW